MKWPTAWQAATRAAITITDLSVVLRGGRKHVQQQRRPQKEVNDA